MKDAVTSRKPKGAKADASPRTSAADEPVVIGVPHRRLGRTLRELRQETGLPIATAAKAVRMSPSALQRLEAGEATKIEDEKLTKLCRLYKAMDKLPDLKTLAAQRKEQSWWDENTDMLAPSFKVYLGLEAEANHLTVYRPDIVSSLFQTDEYAQVLDRSFFPADDTDQEQRNAVRRRRQNLITRSLAPIEV
ncbi:Scr1 family TA system antitoxin-like transcriptional regulator, partial [Nocardia goodfellowii]